MSDNHCEVSYEGLSDDADPVDFWTITRPVARKDHACCECREKIPAGQKHQRIAYKFEGKFNCDRRCAPCAETAAEFDYHIFGGSIWAHFAEEWDNGANLQGCLNRLTSAEAKAHMRRQWLRYKKLEPPIESPQAGGSK